MTIFSKEMNSKVILTMPHNGTKIPKNLKHNLNFTLNEAKEMRNVVDSLVPEITGFHKHKYSKVWTDLPRILVDVNRLPNQVDKYSIKNGGEKMFPHGLIWRTNMPIGENFVDVLKKPYSKIEFEKIMKLNYYPYINKVKQIMESSKKKFGEAIQIDLHSMPSKKLFFSKKTKYHRAYYISKNNSEIEEDFIVLFKNKSLCRKDIANFFIELFEDKDFCVKVGTVSKVKTTNHLFGDVKNGFNSLSIECVENKKLCKKSIQRQTQKLFKEYFQNLNSEKT